MSSEPRVLMVEDDGEIAELYQLKLQLDGYRVAVASSAISGFEQAKTLRPDLILLDIHLPEVDGMQLLGALREDQQTRELPVVIFSDDDNPELIRQAQSLNVVHYLVKAHLLPSGLSRTISEVLSSESRGFGAGNDAQQAS